MSFFLFLLWTFVIFARPQDFVPFISVLRPALLLTAGVMAASFLGGELRFAEIFKKHSQVKRYYFLYFLMILGLPFSIHLGNSVTFTFLNYLTNILFFSFFIIHVNSAERLKKVLFILILAALFYSVMSLLSGGRGGGRFSFGSMYDPNDLACFLISLFPFCFYFLTKKESSIKRIIAVLTVVISLMVIFLTGSRGGVIGLVAVGLFLFISRLSPLKFYQKILLLTVFVVALGMNLDKIDTDRYSSILNPEDDYNVTREQGRLTVWHRGWQITLRHPFTGVGADNFHVAIGRFREEIGEPPRWQAPHNPYVQIMTEVGFPGLFIFVLLIINSLKLFFHSARDKISSNDSQTDRVLMSRAILIAFIGNLTASFFLSMAYSMLLTLFLALAVVVHNLQELQVKAVTQEVKGG